MSLSRSEVWRYALSAFKLNRRMALMNAIAVAIAVVYVIVPCYAGLSLYQRQCRILGESELNLIVAMTPIQQAAGAFTRDAVAEWNQRPEVAIAFAKTEQQLKVWPGRVATPEPFLASVEATIPEDPAVRADRLAWGQPPESSRALSAIISRSFLRRLGGELHESGPTINELTVGANRTCGGQAELLKVTLRIAGILDAENAVDTVYVPLDVAERIDQWCLQRIPAFGTHVGHVPVGDEAEAFNRSLFEHSGPIRASLSDGSMIDLHAAAPPVNHANAVPAHAMADWMVSVSPEVAECYQVAVGDRLPFTIKSTRGETRTFSARVVRITRSSVDFLLPESIHHELARWYRGWSAFDPESGSFISLTRLYARQGHPRCNIYAKGPEEVRTLVAWLESRGYRTENRLAVMESLRTMAVAITVLVGLLSVGCLVIAIATVYLSSSMSAQARAHEIGVLQALGLQRRTISSIFARQGFVVGVLAFAVASTAIAVGEPVLRQVAAEVVALPLDELFERPMYSIEYLWIHALALAVAVLICMAGAAMPARGLAKRRVTELLRLQV